MGLIKMKILGLFFMAALVNCWQDENECNKRAFACMYSLYEMDRNNFSEFGDQAMVCREFTNTIDCLQKVNAEFCVGDGIEIAMENSIANFMEEKNYVCRLQERLSDDDEIQKCVEENAEYLSGCLEESAVEVMLLLSGRQDEKDFEDRFKCDLFIEMDYCISKKLDEKCGFEALKSYVRKVRLGPEEVQRACEAIGFEIIEVGCLGDERECYMKTFSCMASFIEMEKSNSSEYGAQAMLCREFTKTIDCFQKVVPEFCAGDEYVEVPVQVGIEKLIRNKKQACRIQASQFSDDDEAQQCIEENIEYMSGCLEESAVKVMEDISDRQDEEDFENRKKCFLFLEMDSCISDKLKEKCGREAYNSYVRKVKNGPEEVRKACEAVELFIVEGILDEIKKK